MKKKVITLLLAALAVFAAGGLWAEDLRTLSPRGGNEIKSGVTPYGATCPKCSNYGFCRNELRRGEAATAMDAFFSERGYDVRNLRPKGRFIRAEVYKGEELVDRVIFDRRTGRIRSIY